MEKILGSKYLYSITNKQKDKSDSKVDSSNEVNNLVDKENESIYANYTKTKKIALALPDYSYYHSPSDILKEDSRFIGRDKIKEKLRNFLNNTAINKGTYLVAGYRGAGKTSFVNTILNELTTGFSFSRIFNWFIYLFLATTILTFIDKYFAEIEYYKSIRNYAIILTLPVFAYLIATRINTEYRRYRQYNQSIVMSVFIFFYYMLLPKINPITKRRYLKYAQFYMCLYLFCAVGLWGLAVCTLQDVLFLNVIYAFVCFVFLLLRWIIFQKKHSEGRKDEYSRFYKFKKIARRWGILFVKLFNYRNAVHIRVNFSQNDISELNVLKLLAIELYGKVNEIQKNRYKRYFYFTSLLFISYIFYGNLFYSHNISNAIDYNLNNSSYYNWVPYSATNCATKVDTSISWGQYAVVCGDNIVQSTYTTIVEDLRIFINIPVNAIARKIGLTNSTNFQFIPLSINYFFWFWFLIFYLSILLVLGLIRRSTPRAKSIQQLKDLCENIDSSIIEDKTGNTGYSIFQFSIRRERTYPKATVEYIESKLHAIFKNLGTPGLFQCKYDFVIVFDELDKLENVKMENDDQNYISSPNKINDRQKVIFKMLMGLKGFFTKVNAKFIFIAGNEMYDAALSDESDRNFTISSLFDGVIYVDSFLSDENQRDITYNVEKYVCHLLLPNTYQWENYNLQNYKEYLQAYRSKKQPLTVHDIEIIITKLRHFIVYVTHKSCGITKRMVTLVEDFIREGKGQYDKHEILVENADLFGSYLVFEEKDQYIIGYYNYLISPISIYINNNSNKLGDKLMISTSFLINHIYKFHKFGFAWRNLEISPEILDMNKMPASRQMLFELMKMLKGNHINENINGLYNFKFNHTISSELAYLSKLCDDDSAKFNFSYDDMVAVKQFYYWQLNSIKRRYQQGYTDEANTKYVHSIARIILILADLNYFEENYTTAITEYLEGIQYLRYKPINVKSKHLFLLVRNMLKLGLVYEKQRMYSSASFTYEEALNFVLEYKNAAGKNSKEDGISRTEGVKLLFQPLTAYCYAIEKSAFGGFNQKYFDFAHKRFFEMHSDSESNKFISADFWMRIGHLLFYKNSRNIQLNNGHSILHFEKMCSVCKPFINNCTACQLYQHALICSVSSIFDVISDDEIVSARNRPITMMPSDKLTLRTVLVELDFVRSRNLHKEFSSEMLVILAQSCASLADAMLSCNQQQYNQEDKKKVIVKTFDVHNFNNFLYSKPVCYKKISIHTQILILYYYANRFYRSSGNLKASLTQRLKILKVIRHLEIDRVEKINLIESIDHHIVKWAISDAFSMYSFIHKNEMNKINAIRKSPINDNGAKDIHPTILEDILELMLLFYDIKQDVMPDKINFYNLIPNVSVNGTVNKMILLRFKSKCNYKELDEIIGVNLGDTFDDRLLRHYYQKDSKKRKIEFLIIDSIYCCTQILNILNLYNCNFYVNHTFKASIHKYLEFWSKLFDIYCIALNCETDTDAFGQVKSREIIRNISDSSSVASGPSIKDDKSRRFEEELKKQIGADSFYAIDANYHSRLRLKEYYNAIETHNEGQTYKEFTANLFYLDSDFNDDLYHFATAEERFILNLHKDFSEERKQLRDEVKDLKRFDYKNYIVN